MTDQQQTAPPAAPAVNGQAPTPPEGEECETCVTAGEKALALFGIGFAVGIIVVAVDLFSGGKWGLIAMTRRSAAGEQEGQASE